MASDPTAEDLTEVDVITVRIPVPRGLGPNLIGLFGLIAFALAVGGLTGNWWWTVLVGGAFAVAVSYVAHFNASVTAAAASDSDRTQEIPRLATARSA